MVYVIQVRTELQFRPDPARKLSANLCHIYHWCVQWKTPDGGQRNCPKHVEFYSENKFEKLMHLVGIIIRKRLINILFYFYWCLLDNLSSWKALLMIWDWITKYFMWLCHVTSSSVWVVLRKWHFLRNSQNGPWQSEHNRPQWPGRFNDNE